MRRAVAATVLAGGMVLGFSGPAMAQQVGLVNVSIGDVTILRNVDVALAANVVANLCAQVEAEVLVLAQQVRDTDRTEFVCTQRGNGRAVAITDA